MKKIHIIGGGTVAHIRPHFAISAPAYGKTARDLYSILVESDWQGLVYTYTTKMAGNRKTIWQARSGVEDMEPLNLETNADVSKLLDDITVLDPEPSIVFLPAALCDFEPKRLIHHPNGDLKVGKDLPRLFSESHVSVEMRAAEKVIRAVRKQRKDIFLVGFKTTTGASKQEQFDAGLRLMKQSSCNLVLANDLVTRVNMVITPEQAPYHVSTDRRFVLRKLVEMTLLRSQGHFTRSEVREGTFVPWSSSMIPASLRTVVDHCIKRGAYKPFLGKTVGHFALRCPDNTRVEGSNGPAFITSRRGVDFNKLDEVGMVWVAAEGNDKVIAWGGKPSVGGQSQRIIFAEHPDADCIVHFHCPLKPGGVFPTRSQEPYECGSHECGQNTSRGLERLQLTPDGKNPVWAVMLDKHGPNIVFKRNVDPQVVIRFIENNFDLERSTSEVL